MNFSLTIKTFANKSGQAHEIFKRYCWVKFIVFLANNYSEMREERRQKKVWIIYDREIFTIMTRLRRIIRRSGYKWPRASVAVHREIFYQRNHFRFIINFSLKPGVWEFVLKSFRHDSDDSQSVSTSSTAQNFSSCANFMTKVSSNKFLIYAIKFRIVIPMQLKINFGRNFVVSNPVGKSTESKFRSLNQFITARRSVSWRIGRKTFEAQFNSSMISN